MEITNPNEYYNPNNQKENVKPSIDYMPLIIMGIVVIGCVTIVAIAFMYKK
jgi:hypothetical protein